MSVNRGEYPVLDFQPKRSPLRIGRNNQFVYSTGTHHRVLFWLSHTVGACRDTAGSWHGLIPGVDILDFFSCWYIHAGFTENLDRLRNTHQFQSPYLRPSFRPARMTSHLRRATFDSTHLGSLGARGLPVLSPECCMH